MKYLYYVNEHTTKIYLQRDFIFFFLWNLTFQSFWNCQAFNRELWYRENNENRSLIQLTTNPYQARPELAQDPFLMKRRIALRTVSKMYPCMAMQHNCSSCICFSYEWLRWETPTLQPPQIKGVQEKRPRHFFFPCRFLYLHSTLHIAMRGVDHEGTGCAQSQIRQETLRKHLFKMTVKLCWGRHVPNFDVRWGAEESLYNQVRKEMVHLPE